LRGQMILSVAGGSVAIGRVSHARQVKGYSGPPGLGSGMGHDNYTS